MKIDILIVLIVLAVVVAIVAPVSGDAAHYFAIATSIAIALLFFLYGARLSPAEALAGFKHWKLHLTILVFTFVLYPLIGLGLKPLSGFVPDGLYDGILYLTLVPSTVQSSVAFTSIAHGNVAGSIVSASASNLLGVFLTPLLVMLTMQAGGGVQVDAQVFIDIAVQLLLPFILGQLARKWVKGVAAHKATKVVDRGSITMVVYSAFSAGMVSGVWQSVTVGQIVGLCVFSVALVVVMLALTRWLATLLRFDRADRIAIEFCGSKKSLATGLPMASVIFGTANLGLLILPLMIYHQVQLMICSLLASHYAKAHEPDLR
ncbi:bile acid:sodium symporter [Corynebacterium hindlerae]|uniref:bile acid:sodium symporter family protein n=1 Tax=Corynebacterium hindlerae TaxID=699041 RepID=UPI001AD795F6|nr:bile acid:sodium symporter family protein [Corynebacterium hindlerae]QTH59854.1 bile acid:sodium symporter [Corynebacterium hindlerae]